MRVLRVPAADLRVLLGDVARRDGTLVFQSDIAGDSMAPLINDGDRIVIHAMPVDRLAIGDTVLFFNSDGKMIAHRLIRMEETSEGLLAHVQGMDPASTVEVFPARDVMGRVISVMSPGTLTRWGRRGMRLLRRIVKRARRAPQTQPLE